MRLLEIFDDPDVTMEELANVISADPALTVKIIDYCNSPLLGRTSKTSSLQQGVVTLGMRSVKMIALSFSLVRTAADDGFDYLSFWNQSLATAIASKNIFEKKSGNGEDAFLVGLMLNIGQIAIAHCSPEQYLKLKHKSFEQNELQQNVALANLEHELWSMNHYEIGTQLLERWNFPPKIYERVRSYGETLGQPDVEDEFVQTLSLAEQLVAMLFNENYAAEDVQRIRGQASELLAISDPQFEQLFEQFILQWSEYAKLLKFECVEVRNLQELEDRAKKGITKMMLGIHVENVKIHEENEQLKAKVMVDELTGLKNRRAYESELASEIERSRRMGTPLAILVLDIDFFKSVNDQYGHDGGDAVLMGLARCLSSNIRPYDSAFRFGGEEFVVMLTNCDQAIAQKIAERIRGQIEDLKIRHLDQEIQVTTSIGVAAAAPPNLPSLEVLFKLADEQLYLAKNSGRNCCCVTSTASSLGLPTLPAADLNLTSPTPTS